MYEIKGILSNQLIFFWQFLHFDLAETTFPLSGSLYIHTLLKLPHKLPSINTAI